MTCRSWADTIAEERTPRAASVFTAALVVWLGILPAWATQTIKIGCIYPLTNDERRPIGEGRGGTPRQ
jgi:hypothetical protein